MAIHSAISCQETGVFIIINSCDRKRICLINLSKFYLVLNCLKLSVWTDCKRFVVFSLFNSADDDIVGIIRRYGDRDTVSEFFS